MLRQSLLFSVLLIGTSIGINVLQLPIWLLLRWTSRPLYRSWIKWTQELFTSLVVVISALVCPTTIVLSGDLESLKKDRLILFANHQIYTDWWYVWELAWARRLGGSLKIILKASLGKLPIFGWGMTAFEFIFLQRKWEADKETLLGNLERARKDARPLWLLLFPEGTNFSVDTKARSVAFAKKNDITQVPKHVLLPRSTGLLACISELKKDAYVQDLVDLTMGFTGVPPSDFAQDIYTVPRVFTQSIYPSQVHIHIQSYKLSQIPGLKSTDTQDQPDVENADFTNWLYERFQSKDQLMAKFYTQGCFTMKGVRVIHPSPTFRDWMHVGLCLSLTGGLVGLGLFLVVQLNLLALVWSVVTGWAAIL